MTFVSNDFTGGLVAARPGARLRGTVILTSQAIGSVSSALSFDAEAVQNLADVVGRLNQESLHP